MAVLLSLKPTNGGRTYAKDTLWNDKTRFVHSSRLTGQVRVYSGVNEEHDMLEYDCPFKGVEQYLKDMGVTRDKYPLVLAEDAVSRDAWYVLGDGTAWLEQHGSGGAKRVRME